MKRILPLTLVVIATLMYALHSSREVTQAPAGGAALESPQAAHPNERSGQVDPPREPTRGPSAEREALSVGETAHTALKPSSQGEVTSAQGEAIKEVLGVQGGALPAPAPQLDDARQGGEEGSEEMVFSTDREGIKSAVMEMNEQIRECYNGWIQSNPELKGRVVLAFTISPPDDSSGERSVIEDAKLLVDELEHPMMSSCLLNSAQGLKFEAVQTKSVVHYPYRFRNSSAQP